jgi:Ni,Fe-hydrogenase maturation factor
MEITPPEMCLIGIQPKSMDTSTELSDVVSSQMDNLIEKVLGKLKEWEVEITPKQ